MGLFDDFLGGPEAPDPRDQFTGRQLQQLFNPLVSGVSGALFGETLPAGKYAPVGGEFQQDPFQYQGPYAAGVSPLQEQFFQQAPQVGQQQLGLLGGIAGGQAPLEDIYNYGQRFAEDVITPNVMERFAGLGTSASGGAQKGLARELGTFGLGLSSQIGQASLQNQAQQLAATQALGQVPPQLGLAGAEQRNVAQQQISGDIARQQALHPLSSPAAQFGMNLLGLRTTPQAQPAGLGYSLLAGAAPAFGAAATGGLAGALSPDMTFGQGALGGLSALYG